MIPGFPQHAANMSLREYYTGQAVIGYLAQHDTVINADGKPCIEPLFQGSETLLAKAAVRLADALIAALEAKPDA